MTGLKDSVAVVSSTTTGFVRDSGRSRLSLAVEASTAAVRAAGLTAADIDGVCGRGTPSLMLAAALGLPECTWWSDVNHGSFSQAFLDAVAALHSGLCNHVLAVHPVVRLPYQSRAAAADPLRQLEHVEQPWLRGLTPASDQMAGPAGYAVWAARYLHDFKRTREDMGLVAINSRTHAMSNPGAVFHEPLTMSEYLDARMVIEPFGLLDMDIPADGAHAFVLSRTGRAADLVAKPVRVHAAALGMVGSPMDQLAGLERTGQHVVADRLRATSDVWLDDLDLYYPYDGFSWLALTWTEALGWCGPGEAGDFLREHWADDRVHINGRVEVNTHGGSLSEAATQGSGHLHGAVERLQSTDATTALVTPGGLFHNPHGFVLHS